MHLPLLTTVAIALGYALIGGVLARRIGLPTIVGYLVAGVALGPFTPGFHGDRATIEQLAELGVILLMFGVGTHFSLRDLWQVRSVAVPGAIVQMAVLTVAGYFVAVAFGWSTAGAWIFGIAVSVASTVVALRNLMDFGHLQSGAGRASVGWLVFQDLATVAILVLLPSLVGNDAANAGWTPIVIAAGKAVAFLVVMFVVGARVIPAALGRVANTRSRELFVLIALTAAVGTALAAAELFGVSLALGAFIAGLVVSESPFSHQVSADLLPFREAFAVLFFVSVGMLVDPVYLASHWLDVLAISTLIIVLKALVATGTVAALPQPMHSALVLGAATSQIGEFSFIIGQAGVTMSLITTEQYSLILAGAIVSITLNPLMFRLIDPTQRWLQQFPSLWNVLDRHGLMPAPKPSAMRDHVVIIGSGRVGRHIAEMLGRQKVQRLVIESDPSILSKLQQLNIPVLYGDAANSEILEHAALPYARMLVITVSDDISALTMTTAARALAPKIRILARASSWEGQRRLQAAGAQRIVRPELEGGVEIVRQTLRDLDFSAAEAEAMADLTRKEAMETH